MTPAKRKQVTEFIVKHVDAIIPDKFNKNRVKTFLEGLNNKDFEDYVRKLGTGEHRLSVIAPNGAKVKLDLERNLAIAKSLGISFFQRLWFTTPDGKGRYLSHDEYMVLDLPVRRQCQLLTKKISIPTDNKSVDTLTGQPAGKSKGSKISFPELQTMAAQGFVNALQEAMRFRGGDNRGRRVMDTQIINTGRVSLRAIENYGGKVGSTVTLDQYLTAMHLANNLSSKG